MTRYTKWTVIMFLGFVVISFAALISSPFLDNWIGLLAGRDLRILRTLAVEESTVDELMSRTYGIHQCRAYHLEGVLHTVVDCDVTDRAGSRVTLSWEISHSYSPHPRIPRKKVFVCPLNSEAALLTPSLMPPGMRISDYPEQRVYYSRVVYGIASMRWIDGDPSRVNNQNGPGER